MTIASFYIFSGTSSSGSGSVTLYGTTAVLGAGTAFTTQIVVGDVINVNGEVRRVTVISDNAHLTVATAFAASNSGLAYTIYPMVNIENLSTHPKPPADDPRPYSITVALGDKTDRGMGWSTTIWKWGFLSQAQRNELKALCPNRSISTFIKTRNLARVYTTYQATLTWPDQEEVVNGRVLSLVLSFKAMVEL